MEPVALRAFIPSPPIDAAAGFLIWLGHHAKIKRWGLFALYVAGYSAFRIFEELVRIDSSTYFFGLRLNLFVAVAGTISGLVWFVIAQRLPEREMRITSAADGAQESRSTDLLPQSNDSPDLVPRSNDSPNRVT